MLKDNRACGGPRQRERGACGGGQLGEQTQPSPHGLAGQGRAFNFDLEQGGPGSCRENEVDRFLEATSDIAGLSKTLELSELWKGGSPRMSKVGLASHHPNGIKSQNRQI